MDIKNQEIKNFLKDIYNIDAIDITATQQGVINSNYRIQATDDNVYLFKIYNLRNAREVDFELRIKEYLGQKDFPCPRIVKNKDNQLFSIFKERPCVLLNYIPGEIMAEATPELKQKVGELVGLMHGLLADYEQTIERPTWEPADIKSYINTEKENVLQRDFDDIEAFISYIVREFEELNFPDGLPVGMTHQDVKPENIIIGKDGEVSFIDFNDCYRGVLLYDIMTTVIYACFKDNKLQEDLFTAYVKGYLSQRELTELEKEYFFDALRFRLLREAFVWPMRWLDGELARKYGKSFLLSYKNLKKSEKRYKSLIEELWKN